MTNPIRSHRFRLLLVSRTLSQLGDAAVPAALTLAVLQTTRSSSALGLALACASVPRVFLVPLGGVIADRFQARRVAIATDVIRCAVQVFVGVQLLSGAPQMWAITVAQALSGTATAFAVPTRSPLVTGIVDPGGLQKANSLLGASQGLTQLGGPVLAGAFALTVGSGWTFMLDAATFVVSAVILLSINIKAVGVLRQSLWSDLMEGWSHVRSRDWLWTSLIAHAIWNWGFTMLLVLGPTIAIAQLGGDGVWILTLQVGAIGLMAGSMAAARLRIRRPILVGNLAMATFALPLVLFALAAAAPITVASYAIAMIGLGTLNPLWENSIQTSIPAHALARVSSYDWFCSYAVVPVTYLLTPLAAAFWGQTATLVTAAVLVGAACLATALVPGVRRFESSPAPTPVQAGTC